MGGGPDSPRALKSSGSPFLATLRDFDRFTRHQTLCLYGAVISAFLGGVLVGALIAINLH